MIEGPAGRGDEEQEGGDPARWLERVCPDCGSFIENGSAHSCPVEPSETGHVEDT